MTAIPKFATMLTVAITAAVPTASAYARPDLGATGSSVASAPQVSLPRDLRSPDVRDAALTARPSQDLRSPDAGDGHRVGVLARGDGGAVSPNAAVSDGFAWGDAGVGAAIMLVLVSLCGGIAMLVGRGRRRSQAVRAA